jgi:cysteine desulfurase/selenocysteine lyase
MSTSTDFYGLPSPEEISRMANAYFPEFQPEPEVCANGIDAFLKTGDTSAFEYGAKKAEKLVETVASASVPASISYGLTENDFQRIIDDITELSSYDGLDSFEGSIPYGESLNAKSLQEPNAFSWYVPQTLVGGSNPETGHQTGYSPVVLSESKAADAETSKVSQSIEKDPAEQKNNSRIIVGTKTLQQIRNDFPILSEKVNGHNLVWLDNGATTQRPRAVIDRLTYYYEHENSNVHRGAHELAARSTDAYENARQTVADFIGAGSKDEVVFVRGTTEGINLVAHAYVKQYLNPGDEIILTILEHHANIVPWQLVAQETGAVLKVAPVDESGQIILSEYEKLFTKRTKFVSATQVSNVLGTVTPIAEMIAIAHRHGVRILVDGAQSVAHIPVNVSALDADFFVFSGHKIFAPTGIGALYGKKELLEAAKPYHGGGNMIKDVTFEKTIYNPAPNKFEAGTGSIADAVGLGAALDYLSGIGMPEINRHEHELLQYATKEMKKIKGLHMIGNAANKASVLSFVLDGYTNEAVGERLNELGIAVRTGHHCAQPVLRNFGLEGTVRPTLALYNSPEDIDALVKGIRTLA